MPNTIQIKRSLGNAAPSFLLEGEIAYVFGSDIFYIGAPGNTIRQVNSSNAASLGGVAANLYAQKTYVDAAINNLLNGAGAAYDTLKELADLIQGDQSAVSSLTVLVGGKLQKDQNLADLTDASIARANLSLGSMALQAANNVTITGGTINGIIIDGGVFT